MACTSQPEALIASSMLDQDQEMSSETRSALSEPTAGSLNPAPVVPESVPKSKNAIKRELRHAKRLGQMKDKRTKEKEERKRKKAAIKARAQAAATPENPFISRKAERQIWQKKLEVALVYGIKLCVDMSFVDIMSPKEIGQLGSQIGYMYSTNKKFKNPFCMHLTSLVQGTVMHQEVVKRCPGFENYKIKTFEQPVEEVFVKEELVYLSPDSPNILQEINPNKVYVIGGLVDGSPKKLVSVSRAAGIGCETARLPIKEYMTRVTPHGYNTILTLNQVYEILMCFHETGSWETALKSCVPQRKGFKLNREVEKDADGGDSHTDSTESM